MNNDSPKFAFILGRERDLCLAELRAVFKRFDFCFSISSLYDNVAIINIDGKSESDVAGLMETLGGTVKIFRIFQNSEIGIQNLAFKGIIVDYMRSNLKADGKFNYGISSYSRAFNRSSANNLGLSIKKELKKEFSLRFVELRDGQEVSSILSLKSKFVNEGFEFAIFESGEIGILIALSNAEEWGNRDYDKPAGDKRSGMLPPKLARAMLNIALGSLSKVSEVPQDKVLVLDPFCGSGNIVLEAMMLGLDV
ncbi:MAG: hypothetical protein NTW50_02250, partial [Candidatus Berkelbacteria bacterium]|nr:hypothetical protein [Candidatus Berkelbacteria bacterium]